MIPVNMQGNMTERCTL